MTSGRAAGAAAAAGDPERDGAERRARRLLRWYPRRWRARYGDEFAELLAADILERPRSLRRSADVARGGLGAHAANAIGAPSDPLDQARSALGLVYLSFVLFVGLGAGVWSQVRTGLSQAGTSGEATSRAVSASAVVLSIAGVGGVVVLVIVAGSVLALSIQAVRAGAGRRVIGPALVLVGSLALLSTAGWLADRSHWFTPAGAALPAGSAAHLATLWIRGLVAVVTPAWIHPAMLGHMPGGQVCAMALAPVAVGAGAVALVRLVRRAPRHHPATAGSGAGDGAGAIVGLPGGPVDGTAVATAVATAAAAVMTAFCAGAVAWVASHPVRQGSTVWLQQADPLAPGHTGRVVVVVLVALTTVAVLGARRIRSARSVLGTA